MSISHLVTFETLIAALEDGTFKRTPDPLSGKTIAPADILTFLAQLRMLQGVPFNTLVPDAELLPIESIRFFFLDRAWTDALVQGALSVGTANTIERAQLEQPYPQVEREIDNQERQVRSPGGEDLQGGTAGLISGFLLRSAAVAGWPGMHVRAYRSEPAQNDTEIVPETHPSRIKLLRLERLAPSVLLVLFDGVPKVVHIEEPRQGIQFGVKLRVRAGGRISAEVPARNVRSAQYVDGNGTQVTLPNDAEQIPVRFRAGAPGVLDLTNTAKAFKAAKGTGMSAPPNTEVDGAEFALQMIRFPARQIYAQDAGNTGTQNDAFKPTLGGVAKLYTAILTDTIRRR